MLEAYLDRLPLVAILRGVRPDDVVAIGRALVDAGFAIVEVPLNSPDALTSIRLLADALGSETLIGAGTVMTTREVHDVAAAGGRLIVMPHSDATQIEVAKALRLACMPGVATPTEGFAALANGADALKLFPAEMIGPSVVKAMRAVFPSATRMLPVGGITADTMAAYVAAGASGFGLGSALFKPGDPVERVAANARAFVDAWSLASLGTTR